MHVMTRADTNAAAAPADGFDGQGRSARPAVRERPRLGFLGLGWIGRNRMQAVAESGHADIVALVDPSTEMCEAAATLAPEALLSGSFDELLSMDIDGVVIATPSAFHAEQALKALERGLAVFCQKPLGRTSAEVRAVVEMARRVDRLLGVDMSYRLSRGMQEARQIIGDGGIGRVFAADLVFHNAYGPDKEWFYDYSRSGGGCVMDLGVHLVDLALWALGGPAVRTVRADLYAGGERLLPDTKHVEDFASASIELETGAVVRLSCSWRLHAGRDAIIEANFHGTDGGLSFRNVGGSFYDFTLDRFTGTAVERLVEPPDAWGGRAASAWARALAEGARFDPAVGSLTAVSDVIDRIYGRIG